MIPAEQISLIKIIPVILLAVVFGLVIFGIIYSLVKERKRTRDMENRAREMGFSFFQTDPGLVLELKEYFKIFSKGHSRKSKNVMKGTFRSRKWNVLDYRYTVGYGKNSHTYSITCASVKIPAEKKKLPGFFLTRETFWHKIGNVLGFHDINFPDFPVFSKKYRLKGEDEEALREIFKPHVLNFFEEREWKHDVEGKGHDMIFYTSRRVKPENLREFLDELTRAELMFEIR
jgi:hypothetical protein